MSADMRAVTAQSDRIGRYFARQHDVSGNDFHALLHVMVAETAGTPLTMAQLRQRMDVSPAAITYLVDRMIDAGHVRRESDPADRRKALLRYEQAEWNWRTGSSPRSVFTCAPRSRISLMRNCLPLTEFSPP